MSCSATKKLSGLCLLRWLHISGLAHLSGQIHGPQTCRYTDDKYPIPCEKGMRKDGWMWRDRDSDRYPNRVKWVGGEEGGGACQENQKRRIRTKSR